VLSAQVDFETQMNNLKALLSDDFVAWAAVTLEPEDKLLALAQSFDLQESWRTGLDQRPDLLQSKQYVERQNIVLRYNKNQLLPSLNLQLTYGHNGIGQTLPTGFEGIRTGAGQNYSYGLVLTIPFSNKIAKNNLRSSRLEKERLLLSLKQVEQQIIVEIDNAVKAARTAYSRVDATRQSRLYAEAALEAEEKKLANGKSTSFFVLQLQRDLTTARLSELRSLADFNRALSNLRLSEGSTLESHKLDVDVVE
jgi:outer membrane protein